LFKIGFTTMTMTKRRKKGKTWRAESD